MKCFKCNREIEGQSFTYAGMYQCKECNTKSGGTISLDDILNKIIREEKETLVEVIANSRMTDEEVSLKIRVKNLDNVHRIFHNHYPEKYFEIRDVIVIEE